MKEKVDIESGQGFNIGEETVGDGQADQSVKIGEGIVQHLTFHPTREFTDGNIKLFGITVKQQRRKLIIIIKIYEESKRNEIIDKSRMMTEMMKFMVKNEIDVIHVVDSKDILDQISKYKLTVDKIEKDICRSNVIIETMDIITGEFVSVEFNVRTS